MRILFIRHGDPDYEKDSLTPRGIREAEALGKYFPEYHATKAFVSPLGRARLTARLALAETGLVPEVKPWLEEFPVRISRPDCPGLSSVAWDWLPEDLAKHPEMLIAGAWKESAAVSREVSEKYDEVTLAFDGLLAENGYVRDGMFYRAERSNHEVLAFFCHFGISCVFLAHLLGTSPYVFWQGTVGAPTSVISLHTEERRPGIAAFRMNEFGSTLHLKLEGIEASRRARFVECHGDDETGFEKSYRI